MFSEGVISIFVIWNTINYPIHLFFSLRCLSKQASLCCHCCRWWWRIALSAPTLSLKICPWVSCLQVSVCCCVVFTACGSTRWWQAIMQYGLPGPIDSCPCCVIEWVLVAREVWYAPISRSVYRSYRFWMYNSLSTTASNLLGLGFIFALQVRYFIFILRSHSVQVFRHTQFDSFLSLLFFTHNFIQTTQIHLTVSAGSAGCGSSSFLAF